MILKVNPQEWEPVGGFSNKYLINKNGVVVSIQHGKRNKTLAKRIDRGGYQTVRLNKDGITSTHFIHRLIAAAYIPNPDNKPNINHINGIKTDNKIENLDWCTHAENIRHAYGSGLIKSQAKQTPIINICSGRKFPSIKKAAEFHSIKYATCKGYLNGTRTNPTCLRYLTSNAA